MEFLNVLSREEMRNVKGGSGCRVAYRSTDGDAWLGYSDECYTQSQAQQAYGAPAEEGSYVSGYCCSSCGGGGFSNATPCST